ncbi:glycosyltransferase [Pseudomonadota bacterium]
MSISLSVILPTRNRSELLQRALLSLADQTLPSGEFEVIVVDNGSTDDTKEICTGIGQRLPNLHYLYEASPGLHVGRHAGLMTAVGQILVYGDDDIRAFPTWLEAVVEGFSDSEVGLLGGKALPDFESPPPAWIEQLWRMTPWGKILPQYSVLDFADDVKTIDPLYVWGCNFCIRKSLLEEFGGFHPDGMPQEFIRFRGDGETAVSIAMKKSGYKTLYHPKASVHHFVSSKRMTYDYLRRRAYAQGISDSYTRIRSSGGVPPHGQLRAGLGMLKGRSKAQVRNWLRGENLAGMQARAYWSGYLFHHKEVANDPNLLAWVLKKNYLVS